MDPQQTIFCTFERKRRCLIAMAAACLLSSGCMGSWLRQEPDHPSGGARRLPEAPTKAELVSHLNANIEKIRAWRATDVSISARGPGVLAVPLSGKIAVAAPRYFRLTVESLGGREADLGSNDERFWIWMRRSEMPQVVTCRHVHFDHFQHRLPIPIQPEWLMEALNVIPIDESAVRKLPADPETGLISLVSREAPPGGRAVQRVILVDPRKGQIAAHSLHDANGKTLALATFEDYRSDRESGVSLPHRIRLDWPASGVWMTLSFSQVEVNPEGLPQQTWQIPDHLPVYELGRNLPEPGRGAAPPAAGRIRLGSEERFRSQHGLQQASNVSPAEQSQNPFADESASAFAESPGFDDARDIGKRPQFSGAPRFDEEPRFEDLAAAPEFDDEPAGSAQGENPFSANSAIRQTGERFQPPVPVDEPDWDDAAGELDEPEWDDTGEGSGENWWERG